MLLPLRALPVYVGSHIRSKPLPSLFGIRLLEPSDSPGGLTHTYASMPVAGLARGRSPRPAPDWLHQLPAWIRRSMRDSLTNVLTSVDVLALVGRFGPPQPLRDVSISMPMLALKPAWTRRLRKAWAKDSSSTYWFQSTHFDCRTVWPFTVVLMVKYGSVSAE